MNEEVSILSMPSESQREMWWRFVIEADGADSDGYWLGWCPLHGETGDVERPTAQFNFRKGVLRCWAEPPCHEGKRTMSLTNAFIRMAGRNA